MVQEELIEFVLMHVEDIRGAVVCAKIDDKRNGTGGGSGHSRVSDPTANKAIRNILNLPVVYVEYGPLVCGKRDGRKMKHPEKWLRVAEQTAKYYLNNPRMAEFYRRRYIVQEDWKRTCKDLGIYKNLYYVMKSDVIRFAALSAVGSGLISPYSSF